MKAFTIFLLLISGFVFSQQTPREKLTKINPDSLKFKNYSFEKTNKIASDKNKLSKDSALYKILNKKPENLKLYTILAKHPEVKNIIPVPNTISPNRKTIKPLENFERDVKK